MGQGRRRANYATDAGIPLVVEAVVRHVVFRNVILYLPGAPIREGRNLDQRAPLTLDVGHLGGLGARVGLVLPQPGDPHV